MKDSDSSDGPPIWFLNRAVLVVRPRQPFVDWVCSFEDEAPVEEEDAFASVNSFLIPEFDDPDETFAWVQAHVDTIFELMLHDWVVDPEFWPAERGWEAFEQWFEYEYIDIAWDLVDEPLSSEPPPEAVEDG